MKKLSVPIKMGMLGMSIDNISIGKQGWVKLPLGPRNVTMAGGREWVRTKVTAMEEVRANRDIIVANEQGEVKEHTPVELSYEKAAAGGYQRVGENFPLPVGGGIATPITIQATTNGNTKVKTPTSGYKLSLRYIDVFNSGGATITVYLRFGTTGDAYFKKSLAANTGFNTNLIGCEWRGPESETLYVNLSGAGTVDVTVLYVER